MPFVIWSIEHILVFFLYFLYFFFRTISIWHCLHWLLHWSIHLNSIIYKILWILCECICMNCTRTGLTVSILMSAKEVLYSIPLGGCVLHHLFISLLFIFAIPTLLLSLYSHNDASLQVNGLWSWIYKIFVESR